MFFKKTCLYLLLLSLFGSSALLATSTSLDDEKKSDSIIIVLTGPSCSGKSTLAEQLKKDLEKSSCSNEKSWEIVKVDDYDDSDIDENNESSAITAENLMVLDQVEQFAKLSHVIVDTVLENNKEAAAFKERLSKICNNIFLVVVYCDPEILVERATSRNDDRSPLQPFMQFHSMFSPSPKSSPSPTVTPSSMLTPSPNLRKTDSPTNKTLKKRSQSCADDHKESLKVTDKEFPRSPSLNCLGKLTFKSMLSLCVRVVPIEEEKEDEDEIKKEDKSRRDDEVRRLESLVQQTFKLSVQIPEVEVVSAIAVADLTVKNTNEDESKMAIAQIIAMVEDRLFSTPCRDALETIIQQIEKQTN